MKKILLICFVLVAGMLMSCDYQKRECVVKASKCLTDEAYRDSLYKGWKAPINKDSLVDSVFALLREQRQILLDLGAEKKTAPEIQPVIEKPNVAPVVERPNVAPIVENVEEPVAEENANVATDSQPKERKWGKLLTQAGLVGAGALATTVVMNKIHCNERFDITVEYKLMVACLNSCGYSEETIDKCGAGIMRWICKDKEKVETIQNRVQSSCSIR